MVCSVADIVLTPGVLTIKMPLQAAAYQFYLQLRLFCQ